MQKPGEHKLNSGVHYSCLPEAVTSSKTLMAGCLTDAVRTSQYKSVHRSEILKETRFQEDHSCD